MLTVIVGVARWGKGRKEGGDLCFNHCVATMSMATEGDQFLSCSGYFEGG